MLVVVLPNNRGAIIGFALVGSSSSSTVVSVLEPMLNFKMFTFIILIPFVIGIYIMIYLPDIPHSLLKNGKTDVAKKTLKWYRGSDNVDKEFEEVQTYVNSTKTDSFVEKFRTLKTPSSLKSSFVVVILFIFMQGTDLNSIQIYAEIILTLDPLKGG